MKAEPDEYGIVPKILPFEGNMFEDNEVPELDDTPIAETPIYENEPGKPSGMFSMGGVNYQFIGGKWVAIKPDGTPMTPGEMYNFTKSTIKRPGHVTGKPMVQR